MAMAEGEPEKTSRGTVGLAVIEEKDTCLWTKLPRELQHKVFSYLPLQDLFRMRCVCRDWRYVIHRRRFRSMYDTMHSSENPSPSIFYVETYYPNHIQWSTYDYDCKRWRNINSFSLKSMVEHDAVDLSVCSVNGLLCFMLWKDEAGGRIHLPWQVWNPLTNKWKHLPSCKLKIVRRGTYFVHAFSDDSMKSYKILMAHNPKSNLYPDTATDTSLLTEIYDSATDTWREASPFTLQVSLSPHLYYPERGVRCGDEIYFVTRTSIGNILLSYDIKNDRWHEEITYGECVEIFEWDGRVMAAMDLSSNGEYVYQDYRRTLIFERNPATKRWVDIIEIPYKIRKKFVVYGGLNIAASGNHLVIAGYTGDDGFRIAIYKRAENYWRLPPTGAFYHWPVTAVGVFLFKPRLESVP